MFTWNIRGCLIIRKPSLNCKANSKARDLLGHRGRGLEITEIQWKKALEPGARGEAKRNPVRAIQRGWGEGPVLVPACDCATDSLDRVTVRLRHGMQNLTHTHVSNGKLSELSVLSKLHDLGCSISRPLSVSTERLHRVRSKAAAWCDHAPSSYLHHYPDISALTRQNQVVPASWRDAAGIAIGALA